MVLSGRDTRPSLRLDPIHAITYADAAALPRVTSPPYDVVGPDGVSALEAADPHNVVRLILPRAGHDDDRYHHAARDLAAWIDAGVLVTDSAPALWVYRHDTPTGSTIGMVGAIGLDGPVLPHESTFDGPVADRVALMSATEAQLEPILLTYHGDGPASDEVDAALATPATISAVMEDGSRHHLWKLDDAETIARVSADLSDHSALIADGHHRFAAYRQVHASRGTASTASGLAVLVDAARHPLELRGVHRVVADLPLDRAVSAAVRAGFTLADVVPDSRTATGAGGLHPEPSVLLITDGVDSVLVRATTVAEKAMPTDRSPRWTGLDAAVLKHGLIGAAWNLDDTDRRVSYVHDDAAAAELARHVGGVAVLVAAPALADVMALAAAGDTMPQKSTSFGPKPRTGLIMRSTHWRHLSSPPPRRQVPQVRLRSGP